MPIFRTLFNKGSTRYHPPARLAAAEVLSFLAAVVAVAGSAVVTKELAVRHNAVPLAAMNGLAELAAVVDEERLDIDDPLTPTALTPAPDSTTGLEEGPAALDERFEADLAVRWFNGRQVRPVRTVWMTVTAYSPDERSCPGTADGITASLHHVETNAHRLVAADTRILPLGSKISIPGYDGEQIVPVLDRGGKIKGHRLDVLFPTHEQAVRWGVKRLPVVVWGYADGEGAENWRRIRDSRR